MKKVLFIFASLALIGVLVAVVALHKTYGGSITITHSDLEQALESNNGLLDRSLQINNAGEYFTVTLYTNGDGGMRWSATVSDAVIVDSLGHKYIPDHDSHWWWPWGLGSGGTGIDTWTFKALKSGSTQIKMTSYTLGTTPQPGSTTLTISVTIFPPPMAAR